MEIIPKIASFLLKRCTLISHSDNCCVLFLTSKDEADEYWFDSKVLHIEMKARKREISCYSQWDARKKKVKNFCWD